MTTTQIVVYVCLVSFVYGLTGGAFARKYPDSLFARFYRLPRMFFVLWTAITGLGYLFIVPFWKMFKISVASGWNHYILRKGPSPDDYVLIHVIKALCAAVHVLHCPDCKGKIINDATKQPSPSGPYSPRVPHTRIHEPGWNNNPARNN